MKPKRNDKNATAGKIDTLADLVIKFLFLANKDKTPRRPSPQAADLGSGDQTGCPGHPPVYQGHGGIPAREEEMRHLSNAQRRETFNTSKRVEMP